jgi:ABC-type uncharacterized transport system fused permease/ATPase subunit
MITIMITMIIMKVVGFNGRTGYFALATVTLKVAAPDYRELWRELSRLEGRFSFVHARTKSCAESVAFFGGDEREKQIGI